LDQKCISLDGTTGALYRLRYCRLITNSAQHFHYDVTAEAPEFKSTAVSAPVQVNWMNNQRQVVHWLNNQGEQVTFTTDAWDLWIIEGEARRRAAEVFATVLASSGHSFRAYFTKASPTNLFA